MSAAEMAPTPYSAQDIEHWVVLSNPLSVNYGRGQAYIEMLQGSEHARKLDIVSPLDSPEATQEAAMERLEYGSGLLMATGDGSFNHAANQILSDSRLRSLHIAMLAGYGGYGNDIAWSHTGPGNSFNIIDVLNTGQITPIYPIATVRETGSETTTRFAVAYAGLGNTAVAAALFDDASHRDHYMSRYAPTRLMRGAGLSLKSILGATDYTIETDEGNLRTLSELSFANYKREAIFGRWPVAATDPFIYVSELGPHSFMNSATWFGRLAVRSLPRFGSYVAPPTGSYLFDGEAYSFTTRSDETAFHWDAEHTMLPRDTHVTITRADSEFYAVTTKL